MERTNRPRHRSFASRKSKVRGRFFSSQHMGGVGSCWNASSSRSATGRRSHLSIAQIAGSVGERVLFRRRIDDRSDRVVGCSRTSTCSRLSGTHNGSCRVPTNRGENLRECSLDSETPRGGRKRSRNRDGSTLKIDATSRERRRIMLVLSRRCGERIACKELGLVLTVLESRRGRVTLGIEAPATLRFDREQGSQRLQHSGQSARPCQRVA